MSLNITPQDSNPPEEALPQIVKGTGEKGLNQGLGPMATVFSMLVYFSVALLFTWQFPSAKQFITNRWWAVAAGLAIFLVIAVVPATRKWFARTTAKGRIGMFVFGVIPMVLLLFGIVLLLPEQFQVAALRVIFLLPVCFLPAIMYYLFMATKKNSLFNEFIMNLERLGLLDKRGSETEAERKNRVLAYQQRFEAVYGAVPTDLADLVLVPASEGRIASERRPMSTGTGTIAGLFTAEAAVPVVLSTVLIALGWLITLPPWHGADVEKTQAQTSQSGAAVQSAKPIEQPSDSQEIKQGMPIGIAQRWLAAFTPETTPVHFAFLGAYFFCLQMLFRRFVRRDLRASAYVAVALRIILAVIGIWVVVASVAAMPSDWVNNQNAVCYANRLLVLGFIIGVFPRVAWQVIQMVAKRVFALAVPNLQTQLPVDDLDGLTVWHEARLEEEDIENIPNMATADIVDLMLNTRIPSDRIIDWVDQAILYTHIGPEKEGGSNSRSILRGHGIRTASSLVEAYNRSGYHGDLDEFEKILPSAAGGRSPMRSLVDALGTNPNLGLIQTWRGLEPHTHARAFTAAA